MATSGQLLSLVKAHYDNDNERYKTTVLQIAAHEAKSGHNVLAKFSDGQIRCKCSQSH